MMTLDPAAIAAYHVGFVVGDAEAFKERHQRVFGVEFASFDSPPTRMSDGSPYEDLHISMGRLGGLTVEVIEVLGGEGFHGQWHRKHGDGIEHIGFWVKDVTAVAGQMIDDGATLLTARMIGEEMMMMKLSDFSSAHESIAGLGAAGVAYFDLGSGTAIELVGAANAPRMRERFAPLDIINAPPW